MNILIVLVLSAIRILGHKSQLFQAIAHLYVGGAFTAMWWSPYRSKAMWYYGICALAVSLVELACFLLKV